MKVVVGNGTKLFGSNNNRKVFLVFFVVVAIYLVYPKVAHYPQYEMKIMYRLT